MTEDRSAPSAWGRAEAFLAAWGVGGHVVRVAVAASGGAIAWIETGETDPALALSSNASAAVPRAVDPETGILRGRLALPREGSAAGAAPLPAGFDPGAPSGERLPWGGRFLGLARSGAPFLACRLWPAGLAPHAAEPSPARWAAVCRVLLERSGATDDALHLLLGPRRPFDLARARPAAASGPEALRALARRLAREADDDREIAELFLHPAAPDALDTPGEGGPP